MSEALTDDIKALVQIYRVFIVDEAFTDDVEILI